MPHKKRIAQKFSRATQNYEHYAFLQKEIAQRLLDRILTIHQSPRRILDVGCGTGALLGSLKLSFPDSVCVGMDIAYRMCQKTQARSSAFFCICGDGEALPFRSNLFDLVVSNCALQWTKHQAVFESVFRILRPGGLFLFSTFGPDTLKELRRSWAMVDGSQRVNRFEDMHTLGDALLKKGFSEPVVDREDITVTYQNPRNLLKDLKNLGSSTCSAQATQGLTTPRQMYKLMQAYEAFQTAPQIYPATYEILFGHAIKPLDAPALPEGAFPIRIEEGG